MSPPPTSQPNHHTWNILEFPGGLTKEEEGGGGRIRYFVLFCTCAGLLKNSMVRSFANSVIIAWRERGVVGRMNCVFAVVSKSTPANQLVNHNAWCGSRLKSVPRDHLPSPLRHRRAPGSMSLAFSATSLTPWS